VVTTRDVTEREEAERARREAEADAAAVTQRWRRVMDKATEPVTVVGADGSIIQSTANGRMLGYGPEDEIGSMFELVHPDDIDIAIEAFRRVRKTLGEHAPYLTRVRHADGSWRWIEARAMNLLDDPEVEGIVINTRDVTEREEADAARRRAETKLVESERRWRRLVQTSTEHITVIAPDGQVLFHSGSEGTLGRRDEDLPRQLEGMLQLLHPDDLERSIELFAKVVADPTPIPPIEVRLLHVDGTYRWSESIARNLCDDPDIGGIVVTSRDITARREAEAELAHQGTHDPLTGLPNRVLCLDRLRLALSRLERNPMAVGVLLLDLDRFKVVNDSLGHSFGDRILVAAAERLQGVARPGDTVARLGGDEFVIVCDGIHGEVEAVALADKVRAALAERFLVDGAEISLTASVGIAVTGRADTDPDELLRDVDAVMYRAKERGRDRWEVFDEDLRTRAVERLSTETALRRALENDELRLHFQPIVDLASGQTIGAEGLIRWEHPTRGLLAPASFVRIAEESGLVTALGDRVLRDGCHQLAQWTKAHPDLPLTVSLNVAAQQLAHGHLVRTVKAALDESGADPSRLCLELTETALLEDFEMATSVLRKLRTLGIQLWVDDFGTGYSSLAYLRRLPLDGLKIDRSFVAGLLHEKGDRAIVSGTIHLAQSFELLALAEGVETREQARALVDMGCTQGQGYLWSSPLPPDAFDTWLAGN
jgi:diguanylate cyclase (GGDEF)-like protein/PAS domain S-box-containing protein